MTVFITSWCDKAYLSIPISSVNFLPLHNTFKAREPLLEISQFSNLVYVNISTPTPSLFVISQLMKAVFSECIVSLPWLPVILQFSKVLTYWRKLQLLTSADTIFIAFTPPNVLLSVMTQFLIWKYFLSSNAVPSFTSWREKPFMMVKPSIITGVSSVASFSI